ncbi:trypsin-1-like [Periplaneta americana]|uniref:trypsin-1-like n=1 Tax=Periplaneta americana TaxID=6978 RepID=UPI0037E7ABED
MAAIYRRSIVVMVLTTVCFPKMVLSKSKRDSCKCVCGSSSSSQGAIVGGVESRQHEFPWLVAIFNGGSFDCGGTLITKKHVLTAAHCIDGRKVEDTKIQLGEHNLDNPVGEEINVVKMTIHEKYDNKHYYNDIGIIELETAVDFTKKIRPACIPENRKKNYDGIMATVAGWGKTSEFSPDPSNNVLLKVDVKIMSRVNCLKTSYTEKDIYETMMCAGYPQGKKDACTGDSGGPLHIQDGDGEYEVIGVVSWGEGCARANNPGVYTKIADYLDWIESNIGRECLCPKQPTKKRNNGK